MPARRFARLPFDRKAQCSGDIPYVCNGGVAIHRGAGVRPLSLGGRSQQGLHRADHFRQLHHQRIQCKLHRARDRDRPPEVNLRAFLSRHVPGDDVRNEPRAGGQQYRPDVGGDRDGDPDHSADGRHLPHARGTGSSLEIFHPRQCRHCAGAVRHHSRLHGGKAGDRRRPERHGVERAGDQGGEFRSRSAQRRLRVPAARLRHQSGPRAAACLAARRACGRPDADLGGAVRPAAQRRALCAAALQDAAGAQSGGDRARPADGDHGADLLRVRRLHAVPAARHQTHVRLFLDRAHGHHRVRLRHGRPARQFRRASCT